MRKKTSFGVPSWEVPADFLLRSTAVRLDNAPDTRAAPRNCVFESQPPFCPTSAVPKMGNIAQPLPAQAGLRMRHTPCGYIQYSTIFGTLNWGKKSG